MKTKYATGLFYLFKNRLRKKSGLSLNSSYFEAFLWLVNFLLVDNMVSKIYMNYPVLRHKDTVTGDSDFLLHLIGHSQR